MHRFTAALIAVMLIFSVNAYGLEMNLIYDDVYHYYNAEDIYLVINGEEIVTDEMPPVILMDRTLVPVREVFEGIGGEVTWIKETAQTKISYDGSELLFTTGSRVIYMGKSKITISADEPAPMIINDKTMVPIRVVADLLGFDVKWDSSTRTVYLADSGSSFPDKDDEDEDEDEDGKSDSQADLSPDEEAQSGIISKIFNTTNGGSDLVYLAYGSPTKPEIARYSSPERVVLDFESTQLSGSVAASVDFEGGSFITCVRSANHEDSARIVLDVKSQPNIEVYRSATGIVIVASPAGIKYTTKIGDLQNGTIYEPPKVTAGSSSSETESSSSSGADGVTQIIPVPDSGSVNLDTSGTVDTTTANAFDYNSVVIDPGHGGTDPGAMSGSIMEKDITLSISLLVRDKLEEAGYNVVMTRDSDTYPTLQDRVDIASEKINGKIPAIYVSIHCNSFENSASNGTQVYYHPDSKYGTILAENIYNANVANTALRAAQIHDGSHLYVIRKTIQPAALVETAFLSNSSDREYLVSSEGQEALAQGIYEGIVKTMNQMKSDKGIE